MPVLESPYGHLAARRDHRQLSARYRTPYADYGAGGEEEEK